MFNLPVFNIISIRFLLGLFLNRMRRAAAVLHSALRDKDAALSSVFTSSNASTYIKLKAARCVASNNMDRPNTMHPRASAVLDYWCVAAAPTCQCATYTILRITNSCFQLLDLCLSAALLVSLLRFGRDHSTAPVAQIFSSQLSIWFRGGVAVDAHIRTEFGTDLEAVKAGKYDSWMTASPLECLAGIVLMDQFTRNAYRGTARMFELDGKAVQWSKHLLVSKAQRRPREKCLRFVTVGGGCFYPATANPMNFIAFPNSGAKRSVAGEQLGTSLLCPLRCPLAHVCQSPMPGSSCNLFPVSSPAGKRRVCSVEALPHGVCRPSFRAQRVVGGPGDVRSPRQRDRRTRQGRLC